MSKFAITHPISALMFVLALVFFGSDALRRLSVSLYPNVDVPVITITTIYPGANPEIVEGKVTDRIEEAVSGIESLKKITSTSADSVSIVVVEFELEKDINVAANDVRDKVSTLSFGSEVKSPIIEKFDVGGAPIISLFITSKTPIQNTKELLDLNLHVDLNIKPLIQRIKGVGKVNLVGYLEREIKISPNPSALNKYNLSFSDIARAINAQNIEIDGGRLISKEKEWKILTKADAISVQDLGNIIIAQGIKLSDIALILDSTKEQRSFSNLATPQGSNSGILLEVQKITGANEIEIANSIKAVLPELEAMHQKYDLHLVRDTTNYIKDSIRAVEFDLILGAFLAVFVVLVFLRNSRITFVASLSIPTSIMGVFALMYAFGMTLNLATMIAITLAIGIIIDDAIVVIENIYKKIENGEERKSAAYNGVKEIGFALVAISCMLLAVFIPIANMSGVTGRFFTSFGITLVGAIVISYIVVITFIPMLSARVVDSQAVNGRFYLWSEKYFKALEQFYIATLQWVLNHKAIVIGGILSVFVASLFLVTRLGIEFLPSEDKAEFDIKLTSKPGISLEEMQHQTLEIQEYLQGLSEVEYSILNIGFTAEQKVYEAKIYVRLSPYNKRERSLKDIIESLREHYKPFGERFKMEIAIIEIPQISLGEDDSPLQLAIYAQNPSALARSVEKIQNLMEQSGKYRDIHTDIKAKTPQIRLKINRALAAQYGFSAKEIALALNSAFSGAQEISYYRENGKEYNIVLLSPKKDSIVDISYLSLRNPQGQNVFLDGLVEIEEVGAVTNIKRYDRQRSVMVYANLSNGVSLGEGTSFLEQNKEQWLEEGVHYKIEGYAKYMQETNAAFVVAMVSALFLIYFILASLYESLLQPVIIMMTLPLSFTGAFLALFLSGASLSLFSIMGLMLLMGLVGKNATLIIDVANGKHEEGMDIDSAILHAGALRLRPILMTTIAMVFGMLPLALAGGAGSGIKSPMGIAMIGGLLLAMVLSLLLVPAFYKILAPLDMRLRKWYA
ncbi:efflux RND transporter permease subunit [Helicobacter turcicus]|uniref:Efflux RND transporter permease subunit n=1 Tax=Helicobacter turcicus TaxID=2867412 RepID=A0ABS7JLY9_9HELI|nr:efflux RND transporter permease subunit [Helicobacter turcicus]MBX7490413.1 efflux RND transporter permease subunit [Helicobacter turcicus]MBX7545271.1 efflux RND transporter permease subunit [Helicobacter turcicus]